MYSLPYADYHAEAGLACFVGKLPGINGPNRKDMYAEGGRGE